MSGYRHCALWGAVCVWLAGEAPARALDPQKRITQFVHTAWTPREGAPSTVRCIAQTPDGYLWMSTGRAAYRFDGVRFELWNPPPEWYARLGDQLRGCPLVTRDGTLWMSLGDGLARIRGKEFAWLPVPIRKFRSLSLVEEDETNLLVIAENDGLYRINRNSGGARRLSTAEGVPEGK